MHLLVDARLARPDEIYAALLALHEGLDDEASSRALQRLVLILSNHIGDAAVIEEAIRLARCTGSVGGGAVPSLAGSADATVGAGTDGESGWMNPDRGHIG
jgi:hypothetical protein